MKEIKIFLISIFLILVLAGCSSTINFESNGGSIIEPLKVKKDVVLNTIPTPEFVGHTFEGWYVDKELTSKLETNVFPKSVELYAKWIVNQYSINIHYEDDKIESKHYQYNANLDISGRYEPHGYTFAGWFIDKEFKQIFDYKNMPARNLDVFAKLIPNQHTITFVTNGGTEIEPILFNYNDFLANISMKPILDDSLFQGWYLDQKFTKPVSNAIMPDEDIILYAKWKNYKIVQSNIVKAKSILQSHGCTVDNNIPDRCMDLSVNGLLVDFHVFYDNWKSKTLVFSIGHMYIGKAVWYSPNGLESDPKYTIGNKPAPESEVQDVIDRIPLAVEKINKIEMNFAEAGLESGDLVWP